MPGRIAASSSGGVTSGSWSSRKPCTANVSNSSSTRSPVNARRRKRSVSRVRAYGATNGIPFHPCTMLADDAPNPSTKRPGAASASAAAVTASTDGPRVYTGTTHVPRRTSGVASAAIASGVNPSLYEVSDVQNES
jgi:hypothetical protein